MSRTKADIINNAYSQMRVRGVTVDPTPDENLLALDRLETMMAELSGRGISIGYRFEENPDTATSHNIKRKYWQSIETMLALRLMADFGKAVPPELLAQASSGLSFLSTDTAYVPQIARSSRMPLGSGNTIKRAYGFEKFYEPEETAPIGDQTHYMVIGDIEDFQESFDTYVDNSAGETLSSYTIDATSGLTIVSDSQTGNVVDYQISAIGTGDTEIYKVKIVGTTSTGRVSSRLIYFKLTEETV